MGGKGGGRVVGVCVPRFLTLLFSSCLLALAFLVELLRSFHLSTTCLAYFAFGAAYLASLVALFSLVLLQLRVCTWGDAC